MQILRAMDKAGILTSAVQIVLRTFLDHYPTTALPIAGPMVLFFKSLSACEAPNPEYGMITPHVPVTTENVERACF